MKYDYLIVGAGLYGSVFAREMNKIGRRVRLIDRRQHIAGNIYTEEMEGIQVHRYGAHIFHTSDKRVWNYVNQFAEFNHYINSPVARYREELYNLPFNMNTFNRMWGVVTPAQAKAKIAEQIADLGITEPKNLEEQALSLVGADVYEKLVRGYTEKQWGRDCKELPAFIIKRLPLRFTYDNNYFNDRYQGIPVGGYTIMVEKMLQGIEVLTGVSYCDFVTGQEENGGRVTDREGNIYEKVVYTGMIDEYFDFALGHLEYRSLRFETEVLTDCDNYQGNAVVNYTEREIPYTRVIEHKHFEFGTQPGTVITREYPALWQEGEEPYYPINDEKNDALFKQYLELAKTRPNVIFGGRLGQYRYYDMDKVIAQALEAVEREKAELI
ncbi:MAG: UDP-galactopyranose mutase [Lachnospiraceae bacterium]|nr:UDP-galactopyranose mutase [Lachnospiraceae bacterium]